MVTAPGAEKVQFSQPFRQVFTMLVVVGLVIVGVYLAFPSLKPVFLSNPVFNGAIGMVFVLGVLTCFWQVLQLSSSVQWLENFVRDKEGQSNIAPSLLAPLAALLRSRGARMQIGQASTRSILDSVATRMDESRDITRYITNLLIFLGLLGTFYGLATTVPAVIDTIRSLDPKEGDSGIEVFGRLMTGLEAQLGGMGTAFATSLIGLAGSLVVGLLDLFAGHGQNRFYRELEEWLSSITRVSFSAGEGEGGTDQTALAAVLDHMAEQVDTLQNLFVQTDISRSMTDEKVAQLTEAVLALTGAMQARDEGARPARDDGGEMLAALREIAEGQQALLAAFRREGGDGVDAESRMRLRSIDVQLLRILEEMSAGRQDLVTELRTDLTALGRALRQGRSTAAQDDPPARGRPGV